jgi:hypothetical protein
LSQKFSSIFFVVLFALVGAATDVPQARAEDPAPSNLELMTTLSTEVVEKIVFNIEANIAGRGIRLRPLGGGEYNQILDNIFTSVLSSKGAKVYSLPRGPQAALADSTARQTSLLLEYQPLEFNLVYEKVYRSHLIGGKRVKRRADMRVLAKLISSPGAEVMWIGEAEAASLDQFAMGEIGRIEIGTFQFVKPEKPSSGWGKLVEPVFVSGIIIGMIYLFFSNQSDN